MLIQNPNLCGSPPMVVAAVVAAGILDGSCMCSVLRYIFIWVHMTQAYRLSTFIGKLKQPRAQNSFDDLIKQNNHIIRLNCQRTVQIIRQTYSRYHQNEKQINLSYFTLAKNRTISFRKYSFIFYIYLHFVIQFIFHYFYLH